LIGSIIRTYSANRTCLAQINSNNHSYLSIHQTSYWKAISRVSTSPSTTHLWMKSIRFTLISQRYSSAKKVWPILKVEQVWDLKMH